jgi:DNA repair protein RadC
MHFSNLRSGFARFGVPQEKKGQKRRNTMNQKRAAQNRNLFTAIEPGTNDNTRTLIEQSTSENRPSADHPDREFLSNYIPVYRIELVRERAILIKPRPAIHNPKDIEAILQDELLNADREKLVCVALNAKNVVIGIDIVSVGTLTSSLASGREIFKSAILLNAAAIILSHNHPSGDSTPSREDIQMTERISKAGEILGIKLLDHIIIAEHGNFSFSQAGRLP